MYIKRVYLKLIDQYFGSACFYKPTGDGLLVIIPYGEKNLTDVANATVDSCIACLNDFASICANDDMINFPVPSAIGFGIARGTACCLHSGNTILDYSGHLLNLASRLMNFARPSGIVIDGSFKIDVLKDETKALFDTSEVYVRGLAEDAPMAVHTLKGHVTIPDEAKISPATDTWETWTTSNKLSRWEKLGPVFGMDLPGPLKDAAAVMVTVRFRARQNGKAVKGTETNMRFHEWKYVTAGGSPTILFEIDKLCDSLTARGIPRTDDIALDVRYVLSRK